MKQILICLFLLLFILTGCSGSQSGVNDLKLEIITKQVNSWVNLMPGSKSSFFISGSIIIKSDENTVLDSIHLLKCEVIQQGKLLYVLHPNLQSSDYNMDLVIPHTARFFSFNLSSGTPIKKELNLEEPISIDLYLSAINKVYRQRIDSINILKTY